MTRIKSLFLTILLGFPLGIGMLVLLVVIRPRYGSHDTIYETAWKAVFNVVTWPLFIFGEFAGKHWGITASDGNPMFAFIFMGLYWGLLGVAISFGLRALVRRHHKHNRSAQ